MYVCRLEPRHLILSLWKLFSTVCGNFCCWGSALGESCALGESSIVYVKRFILIFCSEITVLKTSQANEREMLTLLTNMKCILISWNKKDRSYVYSSKWKRATLRLEKHFQTCATLLMFWNNCISAHQSHKLWEWTLLHQLHLWGFEY